MEIKRFGLSASAVALLAALTASPAQAATVLPLEPFNVFGPTDFEGQVTVDVDGVAGEAMFTFRTTAGGPTTSIARIYFETDLGLVLSGTPALTPSGAGVSFMQGTGGTGPNPGPDDPPDGNNVPQVPWGGTFERFKADPAPSQDGINPSESLTITYDYGGTETDLVAAITDEFGNSRLTVHVLNCVGMDSCVASAVPLPAAVWLFGSGVLGLVAIARRKKAA